jgi:hypothetical protein
LYHRDVDLVGLRFDCARLRYRRANAIANRFKRGLCAGIGRTQEFDVDTRAVACGNRDEPVVDLETDRKLAAARTRLHAARHLRQAGAHRTDVHRRRAVEGESHPLPFALQPMGHCARPFEDHALDAAGRSEAHREGIFCLRRNRYAQG